MLSGHMRVQRAGLNITRKTIVILVIVLASAGISTKGSAATHAVVLTYHHVANDTPASTSVSPAQFAAQLSYLEDNNFSVWPLSTLVTHLIAGKLLPDNTIAITFDDAYQSVYDNAWPLLAEKGWPFTVFVSTSDVERGIAPYMNWSTLAELRAGGADIGNHSHQHDHLAQPRPGETRAAWHNRVKNDLRTAQQKIARHLGVNATLFAYPYGEFTPPLAQIVHSLGFTGVGQHSGAIGQHSDFTALPRFPIGGGYASMEQFALRVHTAPLHVQPQPANGMVLTGENPPSPVLLQLDQDQLQTAQLRCYASGQGEMLLVRQGPTKVTIQPRQPLKVGRTKFNCTAPDPLRAGHFLWWSYLVMRPHEDGTWYSW